MPTKVLRDDEYHCSFCNSHVDDPAKACPSCGRALSDPAASTAQAGATTPPRFCSRCGSRLGAGAAFCGSCGEPATSAPSGEGRAAAVQTTPSAHPRGHGRCQYCQHEMASDAIKCPRCGMWIPEINKTQTQYVTWIMLAVALCLMTIIAVFQTGVVRESWGEGTHLNLGKALSNPIVILLLIGTVVSAAVSEVIEAKLKRMKKGKLL